MAYKVLVDGERLIVGRERHDKLLLVMFWELN